MDAELLLAYLRAARAEFDHLTAPTPDTQRAWDEAERAIQAIEARRALPHPHQSAA
ncbi:hypothetical protein [Deinococcus maricopensis]|uniref:Uncharacterized protein n=1 Tax=Deinococcus maricopensis (strain DSM 21211 / LMG 22137 / NRRL B-23946 / LB-34) TaxID=709986 RepID=E8U716_DEIML|nr:hypothetical protein [Deinococcus maricopensis]ADV66855.1 hypothetical protein Deima_1204 [Deinococcus maricopensis DSM 21211]